MSKWLVLGRMEIFTHVFWLLQINAGTNCSTQKRYLFNVGEQTTRFCFEHKMKLQKNLEDVFFTQIRWDAMGGFGDLIMGSGMGDSLSFYGPKNLHQFLFGSQTSLFR